MSDFQDIRRALEKKLSDLSGLPVVAWENVYTDPTGAGEWIRVKVNNTETRLSVVGADGVRRFNGLLLVDCFVKQNNGTASADVLADKIVDAFPPGTQLVENGKIINIRYSERAGALTDNPWYFVPVTISWYAFIN